MKLTLLAVTRMHEKRICIAGIDEEGRWVRPVKAYPNHFGKEDLFGKNESFIYGNFNIVEMDLTKELKKYPHSEDSIINEIREPKVIGNIPIQKREEFLISHTENHLFENNEGEVVRKILQNANRSLVLVGPVDVRYVVIEKDKTPRIRFDIPLVYNCERSTPCTDLKFIAFCKRILKEKDYEKVILNSYELKQGLGIEKTYLALGLGRWYEERKDYYDMVIGFHTIPDYTQEINYVNLFPIEEELIKKDITNRSQESRKNILDPKLIDDYYKIKIELNKLIGIEKELRERIKTRMIENDIRRYDTEKMDISCRKYERMSYPKDKIEKFVPDDILEKIKSVKEIVCLLTRLKK